ncbi:hypothetical protein [Nocardioides aquiterrae]|uniref:Antibiotic biosynthesis monooxygenase n=1 Tax=Nocardioides aquiterrae TaxID=203799 RepID=A0ABP4F3F6_9ACTN
MSVLITIKVPGNVDVFTKCLEERADEFAAIAERAKPLGAIHHRFGLGADHVLVVDEWESAEQFEAFFANPELHSFISSVGGNPEASEVAITTAVSSPDEF